MNNIIRFSNRSFNNLIKINNNSICNKRQFSNGLHILTPFFTNNNSNKNNKYSSSSSSPSPSHFSSQPPSSPQPPSSSSIIPPLKSNNNNKPTNSNSNINKNKIYDIEDFSYNSNSNRPSSLSSSSLNNSNNSNNNNNNFDELPFKIKIIDINGNLEDNKIYKSDLLSKLKIQSRDIRIIDPSFPPQVPSILVRDKVILLSFGAIRAIIQYDKVLLFESQNTALVDQVILEIKEGLHISNFEHMPLPFEFKVFESILELVCNKLDLEFRRIQSLVEKEFQLLNENPEHNLEELLLYHKKGLNQFDAKIKEIMDAIKLLLQSDEDMALMYLSYRHATGGARSIDQHDEIEILLETYIRQFEQMSNSISQLKETLASTEEFVNFQLDTARNKIMSIQLIFSILTISTGLGSVIAGIFGMNLISGLEQTSNAFISTCALIASVALLTFIGLKKYCQVKNILPFTKKTPNRLKYGLGFSNDSFINPLKDNLLINDKLINNQKVNNNDIKSSSTSMSSKSLSIPQQAPKEEEINEKILRKTQNLNRIQQYHLQQKQQQHQSNQYIIQLQQQIQEQHYQIQKLQDLQYQLINQQQEYEQDQLEKKQQQQLEKINYLKQKQLQFEQQYKKK